MITREVYKSSQVDVPILLGRLDCFHGHTVFAGQFPLEVVLNLSKFNSLSANLDLRVLAAHVAKVSAIGILHEITGLVDVYRELAPESRQPARRLDKVGRGMIWPLQVTPCHSRSFDDHFTCDTNREQLLMVRRVNHPRD